MPQISSFSLSRDRPRVAYYTSGWDECLVVILGGMGEVHAVTVYHAHDNKIDKLAEITAQDSIGILPME
ncbi:hypothetical protein [Bradyrhizobium sp. AUGA SZCCT0283]|uniref:hypothetical protein n=1 Tax=Bradyrhizobium sp. AUGA SZCCT0283 TaxID=2807671 RepID=UPI001BA83AEC|nr:hypothetical protein [Bradyrhizobium sp. AUGA SZCCT0283]MBR1280048.1 hypothetical protein [Bradyrhizobium sp. AUGA SZCCT0283]